MTMSSTMAISVVAMVMMMAPAVTANAQFATEIEGADRAIEVGGSSGTAAQPRWQGGTCMHMVGWPASAPTSLTVTRIHANVQTSSPTFNGECNTSMLAYIQLVHVPKTGGSTLQCTLSWAGLPPAGCEELALKGAVVRGRTTHAHRTYWELLREHGCEADVETSSTRCAVTKPMLAVDDPYPPDVSRPWGTLVTRPLGRYVSAFYASLASPGKPEKHCGFLGCVPNSKFYKRFASKSIAVGEGIFDLHHACRRCPRFNPDPDLDPDPNSTGNSKVDIVQNLSNHPDKNTIPPSHSLSTVRFTLPRLTQTL